MYSYIICIYSYSDHSCSLCLCSSSHCRWSFHWQSLLPATDHRSFHHSSGSPGSLLWLLEAAGCWITLFTLTCLYTQDTCFSVRLSRLPFYPVTDSQIPNCFGLISPLEKKKNNNFLPSSSGRNSLTYWPRGSKLLSLFSLLSAQIITSEESNFTRSNTRILRETFCTRLGWTLVFLIAIHLNSSLRAYLLEKMWMSDGVLPNTALQ